VVGAASANSSITVTLGKYLYRHNIWYFILWNIGIFMVIFVFLKKNNSQYFVAHSSLILNYRTENALFYCGNYMTRGCQFLFEKNNILRNYREMNDEENIINICG